jgi:lipopolysaccharide biosynthesis protein
MSADEARREFVQRHKESRLVRLIAFYLPQFHPIPENDEWWGRGFTEWTNTASAKPLFPGHYQPHLPADLGFYDLRVPETRVAQARMARAHGIEGFCYYHYWFAGRQILERPFDAVLRSGNPDFPFCLCWANQTWSGIWHGEPNRTLVEQTYPGPDDHRRHFETLLPAFADPRHVRVDDKPLFVVFRPRDLPDPRATMNLWRELAVGAGLPGLHLVGMNIGRQAPDELGLDAAIWTYLPPVRPFVSKRTPIEWTRRRFETLVGRPTTYRYADVLPDLLGPDQGWNRYPCLVPSWDNTPRSGGNGLVLRDSTPELFKRHALDVRQRVRGRPPHQNLVFIRAWNEWAEGNHLEPDMRFGLGYLKAIQDVFGPLSDESGPRGRS